MINYNGKNVIVLMQDRCFLPFIPFVLEEKPELVQKFDGFTFYKNSMSFAIFLKSQILSESTDVPLFVKRRQKTTIT